MRDENDEHRTFPVLADDSIQAPIAAYNGFSQA
jgi:hypothetical protein